jgi:CRISPR/Cas system-associated protein Cas10 (large subunit of type III CRISPR-Cas system)
MHQKAREWDKEHGYDTSFAGSGPKWPKHAQPPENRPCDWCGEPVEKGFIHKECRKKESEMWLDILY